VLCEWLVCWRLFGSVFCEWRVCCASGVCVWVCYMIGGRLVCVEDAFQCFVWMEGGLCEWRLCCGSGLFVPCGGEDGRCG